MVKKILALLLPMFVFFSSPTVTFANNSGSAILSKAPKNTEVLLVLLSKQASIHANKQSGVYKLTLKGVNHNVIYFSDRPVRESGHLTMNKFVSQWTNGEFRKDPPNAVMEAIGTQHGHLKSTKTYAIVLTNPIYDEQHKELTFNISPLPGNSMALPALAHSDYVALFVDNVCLTCIGG